MRMVDEDAARAAVEFVMPSIERAMRDPLAGDSGCLHIVIMDPLSAHGSDFERSILYEHSINRAHWDADYAAFARAKARVSWRTGRDGHDVLTLTPHRLEPGDTLLWGSVCLDGIVVAVSGMQPWYDEALAGMVACSMRAIAKSRAVAAVRAGLFLPG
jgi:hypothetical protein